MVRREFADVSSANGRSNLRAYRHAGHRLLALKATEGTAYVNPWHGVESRAAHQEGVRVIHYHFCRPGLGHHPAAEVELFEATIHPHFERGDMLALDIEVSGGLDVAALNRYVHALDLLVTARTGVLAIGYTYLAFLNAQGRGLQVRSKLWWMADYGGRIPRLGAGRHRFAHQHTDGQVGTPPKSAQGIGVCDMSRLTPFGSAHLAVRRSRLS